MLSDFIQISTHAWHQICIFCDYNLINFTVHHEIIIKIFLLDFLYLFILYTFILFPYFILYFHLLYTIYCFPFTWYFFLNFIRFVYTFSIFAQSVSLKVNFKTHYLSSKFFNLLSSYHKNDFHTPDIFSHTRLHSWASFRFRTSS